jgi:hypothetical protein
MSRYPCYFQLAKIILIILLKNRKEPDPGSPKVTDMSVSGTLLFSGILGKNSAKLVFIKV